MISAECIEVVEELLLKSEDTHNLKQGLKVILT